MSHIDTPKKPVHSKCEPTSEQVAAAVMAFQEHIEHKPLNISTAKFMVAMVKAVEAALKVKG